MLGLETSFKARQWVQWKTVIVVITSLTLIHFFLQANFISQESIILSKDEIPPFGESIEDLITQLPDADLTDLENWGDEPPLDSIPNLTESLIEIPIVEALPSPPTAESTLSDIPTNEHIAICISVANQSLELQEWLVHHYFHMNISHFYIMDDGSLPPLSTYSYPGIPRSALTFTYQPRETRNGFQQLVFYSTCLENWSKRHSWMAFIDADEYFDTPGDETLAEVLESFADDEEVGALGVKCVSSGSQKSRNSRC